MARSRPHAPGSSATSLRSQICVLRNCQTSTQSFIAHRLTKGPQQPDSLNITNSVSDGTIIRMRAALHARLSSYKRAEPNLAELPTSNLELRVSRNKVPETFLGTYVFRACLARLPVALESKSWQDCAPSFVRSDVTGRNNFLHILHMK